MRDVRRALRRVVRVETAAGSEWTDGRTRVTPLATTIVIGGGIGLRPPESTDRERGLVTLSRPSAVEVSFEGRRYRARIIDATRLGQIAILLTALLAVIEARTWITRRKERS